MRRPHVACGVGVLAASLALATPRPAFAFAPGDDATSLVVQADEAHEAGNTTEAADLYVRAYRAMSADERSALGEVVVGVALEDLHTSYKRSSDPSFATTAGDLLDEYESDVGGALPAELAEHRGWIDAARPTPEPGGDGDQAEDFPLEPTPPPADRLPRPREREPSERDVVGPVLIGGGAALAIGGAVMIALGAPLGHDAEQSRVDALADPRFSMASPADQATFQADYDAYVASEKKRGKGIIAGGAVLLVAGVGLAVYGVVRVVRHRRPPNGSAHLRPIPGGFAF